MDKRTWTPMADSMHSSRTLCMLVQQVRLTISSTWRTLSQQVGIRWGSRLAITRHYSRIHRLHRFNSLGCELTLTEIRQMTILWWVESEFHRAANNFNEIASSPTTINSALAMRWEVGVSRTQWMLGLRHRSFPGNSTSRSYRLTPTTHHIPWTTKVETLLSKDCRTPSAVWLRLTRWCRAWVSLLSSPILHRTAILPTPKWVWRRLLAQSSMVRLQRNRDLQMRRCSQSMIKMILQREGYNRHLLSIALSKAKSLERTSHHAASWMMMSLSTRRS